MKRYRYTYTVEFDSLDDVEARAMAEAVDREELNPLDLLKDKNVLCSDALHEVYTNRPPRKVRLR